MSKNKVQINQKDLKALKKRFDSLEKFDKYLEDSLSEMVMKTEAEAIERFRSNWGSPTGSAMKGIRSGKKGRGRHFVEMNVKDQRDGKDGKKKNVKNYLVFLEFGTRRIFNKASDFKILRELGLGDDLVKPFMATPLKRPTNMKGRPFFFPALKNQYKELNKKIRKRLKQITK